jgi:hypothetical protein
MIHSLLEVTPNSESPTRRRPYGKLYYFVWLLIGKIGWHDGILRHEATAASSCSVVVLLQPFPANFITSNFFSGWKITLCRVEDVSF